MFTQLPGIGFKDNRSGQNYKYDTGKVKTNAFGISQCTLKNSLGKITANMAPIIEPAGILSLKPQ